jgi:protein-S-isoprenylcysteine O-methyltransferase Ste14
MTQKQQTATRQEKPQLAANRIPPLRLVFALIVIFGCFAFLPRVNTNPHLLWSLLGTAGALLLFLFFLSR